LLKLRNLSFRHDAYPDLRIPTASDTTPRRNVIRHASPPRKNTVTQHNVSDNGARGSLDQSVTLSPPPEVAEVQDSIHQDGHQDPSTSIKCEMIMEVENASEPTISKATQVTLPYPEIKRLRNRVACLRRRLAAALNENASKKANMKRFRRRVKLVMRRQKTQRCQNCKGQEKLSGNVIDFIKEQVQSCSKDGRGMRWSDSTIKMCQFIMYKSHSCYLRFQAFFTLPSRTTIQRRQTGFSSEVRYQLLGHSSSVTTVSLSLLTHFL